MAGIIEHIQSAVGGETAKIAEFIHETFHDRMSSHGHFGRAAVETVAETCRKHPAAIGLAAGLLVDRLLVEEERRHEAKAAAEADRRLRERPLRTNARRSRRPSKPPSA